MSENRKVLILGATGAMGTYLVPEMLKKGWQVDAVSLDKVVSEHPALHYITENAKDIGFISECVRNQYDAIVDFMIYASESEFEKYYKLFLENTKHYIFFSSYRIYANTVPITEESPRLLDVSEDEVLLKSGDYAIYKAQEEDMLRKSGYTNWSILRPAITYSKKRFQLTTLEANVVITRMWEGKTVVLPEEAMNVQATMSWAGDVAKMIAGLILNEKAYGETFTTATAEHHTWREVAQMYCEIGNLKYVTTNMENYLNILGPGNIHTRQQLVYDRLFDRVIDNSKILEVTGLKQEELMPLKEGLKREFECLKPGDIAPAAEVNARMDAFLAQN